MAGGDRLSQLKARAKMAGQSVAGGARDRLSSARQAGGQGASALRDRVGNVSKDDLANAAGRLGGAGGGMVASSPEEGRAREEQMWANAERTTAMGAPLWGATADPSANHHALWAFASAPVGQDAAKEAAEPIAGPDTDAGLGLDLNSGGAGGDMGFGISEDDLAFAGVGSTDGESTGDESDPLEFDTSFLDGLGGGES